MTWVVRAPRLRREVSRCVRCRRRLCVFTRQQVQSVQALIVAREHVCVCGRTVSGVPQLVLFVDRLLEKLNQISQR